MIRKFWLKNGNEETFDLTNTNMFLAYPQGLGFEKEFASLRLGNDEVVGAEQNLLGTIDGEIMLMNDSLETVYANYLNLNRFLTKTPIYLYYQPPNTNDAYYTEVLCALVEKGEVSQDNIMHLPIKMKMLSFWHTAKIHNLSIKPSTASGKKYPLRRQINKGYFYGGSNLNKITIQNDGTLDVGFEIEIKGQCQDPQINFYDGNNVQYGVAKFDGTFDYVYLNSIDDSENIILKNGQVVLTNPASYQNLSIAATENLYTTFVKLKVGINILSFGFGNSFAGEISIRWRDAYVSV